MSQALERGDVFFALRSRVERDDPQSIDDVQRLYMILRPDALPTWRRLVIGRKRLPDARERSWVFVDRVGRAAPVEHDLGGSSNLTLTRGERQRPARPVAEGRYEIVEHGEHVQLAYALPPPRAEGQLLRALGVAREGAFIATVANPRRPPPGTVLSGAGVAYPDELIAKFRGRRFAELDPAFLDHEGCEMVLVGVRDDVEHDLAAPLRLGVSAKWDGPSERGVAARTRRGAGA